MTLSLFWYTPPPGHHTDRWLELPWDGSYLSLRSAGDLGPSGFGAQALMRRRMALGAPDAPGRGRKAGVGTPLEPGLVCVATQTHSLRVICPCADGRLEVWEGRWDAPAGDPDSAELPTVLTIFRSRCEGWNTANPGSLARDWGDREADGWLTDDPRLHLGVTVADCMNLFVRNSRQPAIRGLLHSGWQGTGILAVFLAAARSLFGLDAQGFELLCGPAVAAADYPVPPDRAGLFAARFGAPAVIEGLDGQPCLDLVAANAALLKGCAPCLPESGAEDSPLASASGSVRVFACTESTVSSSRLHSYRRDGKDAYGRMLALWAGQSPGILL